MNIEMELIKYALKLSWNKDTCYKSCIENYDNSDRSSGQCAITTLIVNDYFGGEIESGYIEELDLKHYWNKLNGEIVDLTKNQFDKDYSFKNIKTKTREDILSNDDTKTRYELLKSRVDSFIKKIKNINETVYNCDKCTDRVEKFLGNSIYFGNRTDILILGEAPANNGWRKSGMIWRDINGKFLPSAKVLSKLLKLANIELLDLTFIEAVKCYPIERKNLKMCANNCKTILIECLKTLRPKYVITLGEYPTKLLLGATTKISNIVGKIEIIKVNDYEFNVIPIYHPSPISPKSYVGNVPVFESLKHIINC